MAGIPELPKRYHAKRPIGLVRTLRERQRHDLPMQQVARACKWLGQIARHSTGSPFSGRPGPMPN
jgi:hypothetical protein